MLHMLHQVSRLACTCTPEIREVQGKKISYLPPFSLLHPGDALNTLSLSLTCACLTATVHMESVSTNLENVMHGGKYERHEFLMPNVNVKSHN